MATLLAQWAVTAYMVCFGIVFIAVAFFEDDEPEWLQNAAGWLLMSALALSAAWFVTTVVGALI